jgi:hypothetical protein
MNDLLLADLAAFEQGDLAREDLAARFGEEVSPLLELHDRMVSLAGMPLVDPDSGWAAIEPQLDAVVVPLAARRSARRRTVAIAIAAALVLGGSAFAASRADWFDDPVVPPSSAQEPWLGSGLGSPGAASADRMGARPGQPFDDARGGDDAQAGAGSGGDSEPTGGSGESDTGDDPGDVDQGTGNDGEHDDRGGGNDGPEGDQGGGQGGSSSQERPTGSPGEGSAG